MFTLLASAHHWTAEQIAEHTPAQLKMFVRDLQRRKKSSSTAAATIDEWIKG